MSRVDVIMKELQLRRHAQREKDVDALTPEGRVRAEDVGRTLPSTFAAVFVSPARRAAETMAWFLRGSGQLLPHHSTVSGLATEREEEWRAAGKAAGSSRLDAIREPNPSLVSDEATRLADVVKVLFEQVPNGGSALAVGHSPLIEAAVYGLTGLIIEPLTECEGVHITLDDAGDYSIEELRLPSSQPPAT
jgi:broad specificity phosphatase PhoE